MKTISDAGCAASYCSGTQTHQSRLVDAYTLFGGAAQPQWLMMRPGGT